MSTASASGRADDGAASAESKGSSAPLLSKEKFTASQQGEATDVGDGAKPRKRDFWKIGKKQEEEKPKSKSTTSPPTSARPSASHISPIAGLRTASPMRSSEGPFPSASPHRGSYPYASPNSPAQGLHSGSPRHHSPASSMIFERNVQEDIVPPELSPQIPSHVLTENHIPPALDASAEAITNEKLDPDEVEIITHATHQPAAVTITGAGVGAEQSLASSMHDDLSHPIQRQDTDNASNYGSLDSTDVRRLSFISFADVVHGEQEQGDMAARRDSALIHGHSSLSAPRSPSPIRSPVSSAAFGTSPPTSVSASVKGLEASPHRGMRGTGSPLPGQSSPLGGELNIETMRQALRKTGSGDLSGFKSAPLSAVGTEEGTYERPFR